MRDARNIRVGVLRWSSLLLLAATLFMMAPTAATAQRRPDRWDPPVWVGHVTFLGSNALVGGLTAGLTQALRGGDFSDGFARGALGGAVAYAGRRLSVEQFDGAGLLGRQVSAVGISVVRNAGEGRGTLERLFFPLGPVHVYLDRSDGVRFQPKMNLYTLGWGMVAVLQEETVFEWSASLSAGALVFSSPRRHVIGDGRSVSGTVVGGNIILSDIREPLRRETFAHERVHVLQLDFMFYAWSDPVERRIAERSEIGRSLYRFVDFGVAAPSTFAALSIFLDLRYDDRPHELEANFLEDRGGER